MEITKILRFADLLGQNSTQKRIRIKLSKKQNQGEVTKYKMPYSFLWKYLFTKLQMKL